MAIIRMGGLSGQAVEKKYRSQQSKYVPSTCVHGQGLGRGRKRSVEMGSQEPGD